MLRPRRNPSRKSPPFSTVRMRPPTRRRAARRASVPARRPSPPPLRPRHRPRQADAESNKPTATATSVCPRGAASRGGASFAAGSRQRAGAPIDDCAVPGDRAVSRAAPAAGKSPPVSGGAPPRRASASARDPSSRMSSTRTSSTCSRASAAARRRPPDASQGRSERVIENHSFHLTTYSMRRTILCTFIRGRHDRSSRPSLRWPRRALHTVRREAARPSPCRPAMRLSTAAALWPCGTGFVCGAQCRP